MSKTSLTLPEVGVVVIGRNEGDRLTQSLKSIIKYTSNIVYVDSGSSDNSVINAKKLDVNVLNLDISKPFTAARARNEGFKKLAQQFENLKFVQFVDGDCELNERWLDTSIKFLIENESVAVVCGRLRESHPEKSIYNMLCDIEWDTPIGEAKSCGGIALMRTSAFNHVGGFNENMIAGEEPELCVRLRQKGWVIWRLDAEMAWHDADITRFGQWWVRNVRSGYAFALGAKMHGSKPELHWVSEVVRGRIWGGVIPIMIVVAATTNIMFILGFIVYPLQVVRVALKNKKNIINNWLYAFYVTLSKFPEFQGQLKFHFNQLFNKHNGIIEYKK